MTDHSEHAATEAQTKTHVLRLGVGQSANLAAPCCVWAGFDVIAEVTLQLKGLVPGAGNFVTGRLRLDATTQTLEPGESDLTGFAAINADIAAGMEARATREFRGGCSGIYLRNSLDVPIAKVTVTFRPFTDHTKER